MKRSENRGWRKFALLSWYTILLACIAVWIVCSIPGLINPITEHPYWTMAVLAEVYFLICFYVVGWKKKRDTETCLKLIILAGLLIRIAYVLLTGYHVSPHDLGKFAGFDSDTIKGGHLGYVEYLYKNRHFPDFDPRDRWGYGNPPAFYVLSANVLGITRAYNVEAPLCYESMQILPLLFSCLTLLAMYRILKEFSIRGKWLILLTAIISFHPFFMIMAGTANNDGMMMYFVTLSVLYTIRWWKNPVLKEILKIALALGIAMCTKINAATISVGIGAVFLSMFWQQRKDWKRFILQFAAFLVICAPLGLAWPIRNLIQFDTPLTYIQRLSPVGSGDQYITDVSAILRLGIPSLKQCAYPFMTLDPALETNIWVQTLRTSLFDEIRKGTELFTVSASLLLWVNILLCVLMNLVFFWSIWKKEIIHKDMKLFLFLAYVVMVIAYAKFCMDETFVCTMNYRYIPIALLFPCIGTGLFAQHYQGKEDGKVRKGITRGIALLQYTILQFSILAVVVDICMILR